MAVHLERKSRQKGKIKITAFLLKYRKRRKIKKMKKGNCKDVSTRRGACEKETKGIGRR